jgi:hypothetical protein
MLTAMARGLAFAAIAVVALNASADARPFKSEFKSKLIDFKYGWSREANVIPALVRRFTADMRKARESLSAAAQVDATERKKLGYPFHPYQQITSITTAGQTPRLLSLSIETYAFTGGAHGNSGTSPLLWDRRLGREIKVDALFSRAGALTRLTRTAYCKALDIERLKRRQGQKLGGEFDQCPKFTDLAILPADTNKNGRFDRIRLIASPYVAGPYSEGEYDVALPVDRALVAAARPQYRASFEVQRQ